MSRTPQYDAAGYREIRAGTPNAWTGYRLKSDGDTQPERQMPGTGSLVRDLLAREGKDGE